MKFTLAIFILIVATAVAPSKINRGTDLLFRSTSASTASCVLGSFQLLHLVSAKKLEKRDGTLEDNRATMDLDPKDEGNKEEKKLLRSVDGGDSQDTIATTTLPVYQAQAEDAEASKTKEKLIVETDGSNEFTTEDDHDHKAEDIKDQQPLKRVQNGVETPNRGIPYRKNWDMIPVECMQRQIDNGEHISDETGNYFC